MTRSRTHRSAARRGLAVCALTGAALLTTVTGGTAWADGGTKPTPAPASAAPSAPSAPNAPAVNGATPSAAPQPSRPGAPTVAGSGNGTTATPAAPAPAGGGAPQVREVPKGAAQAGDGSGSAGDSGLMLVGGGTVAAVGAGALGFALLRRRSGARG
ncbi:hypothetical protein [Streptomyces sp. CB01881]|uniref:hypothetical protein n=1 Tax=Streptomyces sp. CB01881 TaxID=2078691 RepID=UPI000CDC45B9|nr:hypothetical protein [Streptomyces sp. CB01881]AUY48170.1 hypothetical protein C2142_03425 [Streptomyces sp. CB01881]TYC76655.1 hypothetical protein EH183_03435 [Streptomyces sp. CB01881]